MEILLMCAPKTVRYFVAICKLGLQFILLPE